MQVSAEGCGKHSFSFVMQRFSDNNALYSTSNKFLTMSKHKGKITHPPQSSNPTIWFFLPIVNCYAEKNIISFTHSFVKAPQKYQKTILSRYSLQISKIPITKFNYLFISSFASFGGCSIRTPSRISPDFTAATTLGAQLAIALVVSCLSQGVLTLCDSKKQWLTETLKSKNSKDCTSNLRGFFTMSQERL